ncbi:helix-turn-helix domain-containing protein [Streptomyces sp. NPDC051662]|uniref:helix-turn-helix domain-containing protein n=1 Tax=Streptomyces sp. NPDC051662 TaxID=3154750 RepID=UPI00341BD497
MTWSAPAPYPSDMSESRSETGKNLKELRKRRGFTQSELAAASGVSLSIIRKLEQGERGTARLETLRK